MTRRYLGYAFVALVAYSLVAPLVKLALPRVPSTPAVFLSNLVLFVLVGGFLAWTGESPWPYLRHRYAGLIALSGVLLTVGLLTYYRALELGPVSVVVPIYGLFIAVSALVGVVALEEPLSRRTVAGIAFSLLAIALISS